MDNYFAREAEIKDIVYDLDKDYFRLFTFERNIFNSSYLNLKLLSSMSFSALSVF